ncbi:hypothetical protein DPMN_174035 [Dreissena polymorpha]|uniref:Uncharacterized protein n=1 Tax=Dreissena polymorpha TaxID=45954 RepID=A0A9D4E2P7_DREPO|nr:hypothetical protein DPMN_174035 [Dreissena polymorpha]
MRRIWWRAYNNFSGLTYAVLDTCNNWYPDNRFHGQSLLRKFSQGGQSLKRCFDNPDSRSYIIFTTRTVAPT